MSAFFPNADIHDYSFDVCFVPSEADFRNHALDAGVVSSD
jgi:hypothetical protein